MPSLTSQRAHFQNCISICKVEQARLVKGGLVSCHEKIEKNTVDEKQSYSCTIWDLKKKKKEKCCDCFARVASTTAPPITAALETSKDIIIPSGVSRLPYIKHKIHAIKVPRRRPSSTSGRCFMCSGGNDIRFSWPCRLAGRGWGGLAERGGEPGSGSQLCRNGH